MAEKKKKKKKAKSVKKEKKTRRGCTLPAFDDETKMQIALLAIAEKKDLKQICEILYETLKLTYDGFLKRLTRSGMGDSLKSVRVWANARVETALYRAATQDTARKQVKKHKWMMDPVKGRLVKKIETATHDKSIQADVEAIKLWFERREREKDPSEIKYIRKSSYEKHSEENGK